MAKDWDKAKALYGMGKTLREIERLTGIPFKTIDRRAKSEAWSRDDVTQKIADVSKAKAILTQSNDTERRIIDTESDKIVKAKLHLDDISDLAFEKLKALIPLAESAKEVRDAIEAAKTTMITSRIVPFYPPKESKTEVNINHAATRTLEDYYRDNATS